MMSPFLNLDDGMEIVDSQVMEDGSAKVYKELFAEEQDIPDKHPFFSEANQAYLEKKVTGYKAGMLEFKEHPLLDE